jgi:potassium efflux system protein
MADRKATQIELDQRRRKLVAKTDDLVDEALAALDPDTSAQQRQTLEARCRKLLGDQLDLVGKLYQTYGEEILILGNIDDTLQGMIREAGSLDEFIQSWLLWARSVPPITWRDGGAFWKGLKWFLSPANWLGLAQDTLRSLLRRPLAALLLAALAAGAFLLAGRAGQESDELRQGARSSRSSLGNASLAVACDVVSALPWPVFFVGIGFLLRLNVEARPFTQCVASALISVSVFSGSANAIRHLCRRDGATRIYFGWSRTVTDTIDGLLTTLLAFVVPLRFLITVTDESRTLVLEQGLGRPAFLLYCAVLGWLLVRALRRSGPLYKAARSTHPDRLSVRWWRGWQAVLVAIPVGLALFAVAGYYYGTLLLDRRIICTAWLCTAVYILNWLGRYWLAGEKQRLENEEEARQEKDEQQERAEQSQESPDTIDVDVEENRLGIEQISEHSRALLTTLTLAVLVAGLYLVWRDLLPALTVFEQKTLWHYSVPGPSGSDVLGSVTVGSVLLAILFGAIAYAAARNIPGVLEMTVLSRLPLDEGVRFALSTVSRYAIITAGILIVAGKLGLQWGKLQWLVAALGVGLGFGLQEIVANFISGLIILFERPFRLGDTVTVGDVSGKVTRIQIRATTIVDWERRELIVPNRDFITGRLINWSLSDPITRLTIPVGIAYGADTEKAEKLLIQVAEKHPDVLDQPEPSALFLGFGDNSLNFELRVFVNGIEKRFRTIHSLHMEIDRVFRKEDIVIAFPQRDTHLDTLRPLDIRLVNHDADDQKKNDGDGKEKDDGKREDHEPQKEATEQEPGGTNNG